MLPLSADMQMQQGPEFAITARDEADCAADQRAVDANKLQVSPMLSSICRDISRVPAFDRIADMASQEGGEFRRHPMRRLLQMLIQRFTQRVVAHQRFAEPLTGLGDPLPMRESSLLISFSPSRADPPTPRRDSD